MSYTCATSICVWIVGLGQGWGCVCCWRVNMYLDIYSELLMWHLFGLSIFYLLFVSFDHACPTSRYHNSVSDKSNDSCTTNPMNKSYCIHYETNNIYK